MNDRLDVFNYNDPNDLENANSLYKDLIALCVFDSKGIVLEVNNLFCALLNETSDNLIGEPNPVIFSRYNTLPENLKLWESIRSGKIGEAELKVNRGLDLIWLKVRLVPQIVNSEVVKVVSCYTDITEAKKNKEKNDQLIEFVSLGAWEYNLITDKFMGDQGFFKLLGFQPNEENPLQEWFSKIHPEDELKVKETLEMHCQNPHTKFEVMYRIIKDNEVRHVHSQGRTVEFTEEGTPIKMYGILHDITDIKNIEDEIEEQKNLFKLVMDNIPFPLIWKNPQKEYRFEYWNKKAEELWGIKSKDIVGKTDYDFFPPEQADFFRQKDLECVQSASTVDIPEERVNSPDGTRILHTKKFPLYDYKAKPRALLCICEDITEKIESNKQLFYSSKMSAIGEIAGDIAHEINNPLAIISCLAMQLKNFIELGNTPEKEQLDVIDKIDETIFRIAKIIKGLKTISREGSNDPFEVKHIDSIIKQTLEICDEKLKKENITLEYENFIPDANTKCRTVEIIQVLLNLINNSKDAIKTIDKKWIKINVSESNDAVKITVIDCGLGIPSHILPKIMNPFFSTKGEKGAGLGLSVSMQIVEKHLGTLKYSSEYQNTCFEFTLPLVKTSP